METGVIPPNIHFTEGRSDIEAFKKGTINVITIPTPWEPTLVGVNSFGFGGANAHILLEPNMKEKINGGAPKDDLPRLVVLSGRTEQAVESFLQEVGKSIVSSKNSKSAFFYAQYFYFRLKVNRQISSMFGYYTIFMLMKCKVILTEVTRLSNLKRQTT